MDKYFVYELYCKGNNKIYVGVSNNPERRFKEHIYRSYNKENKQYNNYKERCIRKYGKDSFICTTVLCGYKSFCLEYEIYLINKYSKESICMNSSKGGEGTSLLIPWNKNTKGVCKPNKTSFKKGSCGNKKLTKKQELDIIEKYKEGLTLEEIVKDLPICKKYVTQVVHRNNVQLRRRFTTVEDRLLFLKYKKQGKALKEISELTGFAIRTICQNLKNLKNEGIE